MTVSFNTHLICPYCNEQSYIKNPGDYFICSCKYSQSYIRFSNVLIIFKKLNLRYYFVEEVLMQNDRESYKQTINKPINIPLNVFIQNNTIPDKKQIKKLIKIFSLL